MATPTAKKRAKKTNTGRPLSYLTEAELEEKGRFRRSSVSVIMANNKTQKIIVGNS